MWLHKVGCFYRREATATGTFEIVSKGWGMKEADITAENELSHTMNRGMHSIIPSAIYSEVMSAARSGRMLLKLVARPPSSKSNSVAGK